MRTTIYLATACGLAVIQGCDESWVGEVCLNRQADPMRCR